MELRQTVRTLLADHPDAVQAVVREDRSSPGPVGLAIDAVSLFVEDALMPNHAFTELRLVAADGEELARWATVGHVHQALVQALAAAGWAGPVEVCAAPAPAHPVCRRAVGIVLLAGVLLFGGPVAWVAVPLALLVLWVRARRGATL